ncbi:DUF2945 domain-containing protein [Streptomyces sp. NPDC048387]|uniref:DUF2945 domain-containing protein n=1 Tax=unclassified Streptomyces TaxID=2593676 RepID=UPI0033D162AB
MAKDKKGARKRELSPGEEVTWRSHGTRTEGTVERRITERTEASGRTVDASPEDPQYEVRSDASGRTAVHRPEALKRKPRR